MYESFEGSLTKEYYVYVHAYPNELYIGRSGILGFAASLGCKYMPFYVGKGIGDRAFKLDRNETHRKVRQKIKCTGDDVKVQIIKEGLTENEALALALESKLIDIFGLVTNRGMLVNLDEGINKSERRQLYRPQYDILNKLNRIL